MENQKKLSLMPKEKKEILKLKKNTKLYQKPIEEKKEIKKPVWDNPQEVIQRGNKLYKIEQGDDETRELYLTRGKFIIDVMETNKIEDEDEIINFSHVWKNYRYNNMSYPIAITKKIKEYEQIVNKK